MLKHEPYIDSERAVLYTDYVIKHKGDSKYLLAGGALKHIFSNFTAKIWDEELLVGNISQYFKGTQVYPEYEAWMLEGFKKIKREEERYTEGTLQKKKDDRLGIYLINPF